MSISQGVYRFKGGIEVSGTFPDDLLCLLHLAWLIIRALLLVVSQLLLAETFCADVCDSFEVVHSAANVNCERAIPLVAARNLR